jgi:hypothetical protein
VLVLRVIRWLGAACRSAGWAIAAAGTTSATSRGSPISRGLGRRIRIVFTLLGRGRGTGSRARRRAKHKPRGSRGLESWPFKICDVFSDRPLAGNQLGIFPEASLGHDLGDFAEDGSDGF